MPFKDLKKLKDYQEKWRKENKAYIKEQKHIEYLKNPEKSLSRLKKWAEDNPELYADKTRERHLICTYGITSEEYEKMRKSQKGRCAICGQKETIKKRSTGTMHSLSVDHDHKHNVVRGLLCGNCNRALGLFFDNEEILQKAIQYLKRNKQ